MNARTGIKTVIRRHFAEDFVERAFGDSLQFPAEKNIAGADGFSRRGFAVNQISRGFRQRHVRDARAGISRVLLFQ